VICVKKPVHSEHKFTIGISASRYEASSFYYFYFAYYFCYERFYLLGAQFIKGTAMGILSPVSHDLNKKSYLQRFAEQNYF